MVTAPVCAGFTIELSTDGPGLTEFTDRAEHHLRESGLRTGLLTLHVMHTSASLLIQENADPDVRRDLQAFFSRLAPHADDPSMRYLAHRAEGPDDMPAHIRAALTQSTLTIPVENSRMRLGTWQGLYLFEHRDRPHRRRIAGMATGTG